MMKSEKIMDTFAMFDVDGSGTVSSEELKNIIQMVDSAPTKGDVDKMVSLPVFARCSLRSAPMYVPRLAVVLTTARSGDRQSAMPCPSHVPMRYERSQIRTGAFAKPGVSISVRVTPPSAASTRPL